MARRYSKKRRGRRRGKRRSQAMKSIYTRYRSIIGDRY